MTEQKNLVEDGDKILVQKDNRQVGHCGDGLVLVVKSCATETLAEGKCGG